MADHMSYMHKSFPRSKTNDHGQQHNHEHTVTHEDPGIRQRTEEHSVPAGGAPNFGAGPGGESMDSDS